MELILACLFGLVGVMFIRAWVAGFRGQRPPVHAGPGQADGPSFTQASPGTGVPAADDAGMADTAMGYSCPDTIVTGFPDPPPAGCTSPPDN